MSDKPKRTPTDKPDVLHAPPIQMLPPRTSGRPRKPGRPDFNFEEAEQERFDYFLYTFGKENPDLTPSDWLILELAGVEYIKLLRMYAKEIDDNQLITMARQNPATNFVRYMDMLSVTRKARQAKPSPADDKSDELIRMLSSGR